ncbi:MAG: hypothetical protein HY271_01145 [Deltaproteobacteria bacterium]|nr:hypothetical protein [Deltaproteobacteria bacterium]
MAAAIDVTRFDDPSGPCDVNGCSLRQAILLANSTQGPDMITLHPGKYRLKLRGDDATAEAGDLDITDAVTIQGDPSGGTVIDAKGAKDRAFEVLADGDLTISHVTVKGGSAAVDGGGILNVGTLTVEDSVFTGNKAGNSGGGIASEAGTCTLTDVVVTKNKAVTNDGGGLEFFPSGTATLLRVTLSKNSAGDTGGAIDSNNGVTVSLTDCTVSGNKSKNEGGGLDPSVGTVTVTNTTISGNHSAKGGGIQLESGGTLVLDHVTIAHNKAKEGAGLWTEAGTTATLTATLVATNTPFDCFGPIVSNGSNLIGRIDGCTITGDTTGNITGGPKPVKAVKPGLAPLKDNGGPTKTHALMPGSPAINADMGMCPPPSADQRGLPRLAPCDIGAFEVQ